MTCAGVSGTHRTEDRRDTLVNTGTVAQIETPAAHQPETHKIQRRDRLDGLIHEYQQVA
jgi:hypothetical protein